MELRATTKEQWLQLQDEQRHARIVAVNQALALTPSLYFGTRRCTYSDVTSVVTTVQPVPRFVHDASKSPTTKRPRHVKPAWEAPSTGKQSSDRQAESLPFIQSGDAASQFVEAPLEGDSERQRRFLARLNFALAQEREAFLGILHERRKQRYLVENKAALVIQRVYRGFLLRRRFVTIKEKLRVRKRIRVSLVRVTKGTAIITGENERKARLIEQRNGAARRIQSAYRRWRGRRILQRERVLQQQELRRRKATLIQRVWRKAIAQAAVRKLRERLDGERRQRLALMVTRVFQGYQARQRVRQIRLRRQVHASQRIQDAVREFHSRKALALQRRHRLEERRDFAATKIQKLVRGVTARERVLRLRIEEDRAIRVACALSIQRVYRGFRGRRQMRFYRLFQAHSHAYQCAIHLTRIVRGFLGRQRAKLERLDQETDVLVQTAKGNTSTVTDLLDGYGLVDEPVELTSTRFSTKNNILHLSARHGHMEILTHVLPMFLEQAPQVIYAMNAKGETPLELAICHGHEKLASFLLTKTADLFAQAPHIRSRKVQSGRRERSLLLDAARHGMGAIVAKLIVLFPQLYDGKERDSWSKRTLLHEAILYPRDRYEDNKTTSLIVEAISVTLHGMLSKLPVDVNAQDLVGFTPLHLAAMLGNLKAVQLLLEYGADVALKDREDRTAWRLALLHGHEACFLEIRRKWLNDVSVGNGASKSDEGNDAGVIDMGKALALAATKSRHGHRRFLENLHPHLAGDLIQAARRSENDRVRLFLDEFHASPNATDPVGDGDSLLMVVLNEKNVPLLRYLVAEYQGELDLMYVNKNGRSVMDAALQSPKLLRIVIHDGLANPCLPLDNFKLHRTTCHEAVRRGYDLREWLRGYSFMPSMLAQLTDDAGRTPLHDAAEFGNLSSAKLLLNVGLRVDQRDAVDKRTPLHEACRAGDVAIVRKMVSKSPDTLWICDAAGQLPAVDAASSANVELLHLVVDCMRRSLRQRGGHSETLEALETWLHEAEETRRSGSFDGKDAIELGFILQKAFDRQWRDGADS